MTMTMMKNGTIAGISAVQPVFAGGQIVLGNKLAKVGEEASRLQLQLSENEVEAQVEQYYWQLVALQEKRRTLDAADTLLADLAKDAKAAVDAGVALQNDLLQVQLRQNDLQSQRLKLDNGSELISLLLAQACGLSRTPLISFPATAEALTTAPSCEGGEPYGLPEYQLLQKNVEAASLQRKMEVAKNLPSVAVGAGYNYHNLLDNDRTFAMLFATVSVPISDWWGGSHAIKRRKLEQQKAQEQLDENTQLLTIRIQKARNDVAEAYSQLQLANRSIEQARENLRIHATPTPQEPPP